ncbi:MAG: phosphate ABC transporter ATP-binding protein [Proteobacteria bacterium]|nr:phosphate ABC transporter ATP-binding protein [Pseudomonadota bacterium]
MKTSIIAAEGISAWYGNHRAVENISLDVKSGDVLALIGPSGCGKSTFLRCLNRMHEEIDDTRVDGRVLYKGEDIYGEDVDPVAVRSCIGMVFQKPNPFPTMTVAENVAAGLRLRGGFSRSEIDGMVEAALRKAALWDEVKNKLRAPGTSLSGGQQQRLCIARALAVQPEVLLMDEPTSALDPISTGRIEELMTELKKSVTIVIVTHNMQQAARISDQTAFFLMGKMVEHGDTEQIFNAPAREETENYISGRFG